MRIGRLLIVLGMLLTPTLASADGHRAGLFGAFSIAKGSTLTGVHLAGDWTPPASEYISVVGDFSVHSGDPNGVDVTRKTVMAGANLGYGQPAKSKKHVGNVHVLLGGVGGGGQKEFATAIGGSYDFVPDPVARGLAFRVQYDRIFVAGGADDFHRISIGALWQWPR